MKTLKESILDKDYDGVGMPSLKFRSSRKFINLFLKYPWKQIPKTRKGDSSGTRWQEAVECPHNLCYRIYDLCDEAEIVKRNGVRFIELKYNGAIMIDNPKERGFMRGAYKDGGKFYLIKKNGNKYKLYSITGNKYEPICQIRVATVSENIIQNLLGASPEVLRQFKDDIQFRILFPMTSKIHEIPDEMCDYIDWFIQMNKFANQK